MLGYVWGPARPHLFVSLFRTHCAAACITACADPNTAPRPARPKVEADLCEGTDRALLCLSCALLREMGHINQLPALLVYTPPAAPPPSAAAGLFNSARQYMDPSFRAAAGAAANAAANSAVGAAAAAAVAAAGAAAAAWPLQVAANYLCLLETARVLLAAPHSSSEDQRAQVCHAVCLLRHVVLLLLLLGMT